MASNFSSIGFKADSFDQMAELLKEVELQSKLVPSLLGGSYRQYSSPEGSELWAQYSPNGDLVGCNVHFSGNGRMRIDIHDIIDFNRIEGSPLEGRILSCLIDDHPGISFVFDSPDLQSFAQALELPMEATVQAAAFARPDFEIRKEGEKTELSQLATEAYIPCGTFDPDGELIDPPEPRGIFSGKILKASKLQNSLCGLHFYSLLLKTLGGTLDVVVDPEYLSREPEVGMIAAGEFYLTARMIEPQINVHAAKSKADSGTQPNTAQPWWKRIIGFFKR